MLPVPLVPDGRTIRRDQSHPSRTRQAPRSSIPVTNAIEALNAKLRRAVRARGHFLTDEAVLKLLFMVITSPPRIGGPARERTAVKTQFAILFEDRFTTT